ncbi:hypothetical protein D3C76_1247810 [compost metagenome]
MLGAAGYVYGDRLVLGRELQFVDQVGADEAHRVIQVQPRFGQVLNQAQGARTGVAVDRVKSAAAGVEQRVDQLLALVLGLFGVALGSKRLAAAQVVLVVREYHLIAGLFQQGASLVQQ